MSDNLNLFIPPGQGRRSIGVAGWNGIDLYASGQIKIENLDSCCNSGDGILVNSFGGYFFVSNATIGANGQHGVQINGSGAQTGYISLDNVHLTDNSTSAANTYSHISVTNFPNLVLSNHC